jgi:ribosomal-protein-serine acetyltransferase
MSTKEIPTFSLENKDGFKWELRPTTIDMLEEFHNKVAENGEYLSYWIPTLHGKDFSVTETFVKNVVANHEKVKQGEPTQYCNHFIFVDGKIIGSIGCLRFNNETKVAEIGYWIDRNFQGKGIATVSTKVIRDKIAFELLGLKTAELHCADGNTASQNVAKRLNPDRTFYADCDPIPIRGINYRLVVYAFDNKLN